MMSLEVMPDVSQHNMRYAALLAVLCNGIRALQTCNAVMLA